MIEFNINKINQAIDNNWLMSYFNMDKFVNRVVHLIKKG